MSISHREIYVTCKIHIVKLSSVFQDYHEEDYFLYIAFSDENVYGSD